MKQIPVECAKPGPQRQQIRFAKKNVDPGLLLAVLGSQKRRLGSVLQFFNRHRQLLI